ncbi:MAG: hypothetical protein V7K57_11980 [Nostoc sp.]
MPISVNVKQKGSIRYNLRIIDIDVLSQDLRNWHRVGRFSKYGLSQKKPVSLGNYESWNWYTSSAIAKNALRVYL